MSFTEKDGLRYLTFDSFSEHGLSHAVFTRHGGVSEGHCTSLNMGLTVGDQPEKVIENRKRSFHALERNIESLSDSWLVHENNVHIYDQPRTSAEKIPPKVDIILADNPEVSLFMRYADCTPILFYDPKNEAIGLAHAGWKGTVQNVAGEALKAMAERYGSAPENIIAAIGPSIGPKEYEVGENVIEAVYNSFGDEADSLLPKFGESTHFDLWAANNLSLINAGVKNIENVEICTGINTQDWFSHRVEKGKTGRFGVLLALPA